MKTVAFLMAMVASMALVIVLLFAGVLMYTSDPWWAVIIFLPTLALVTALVAYAISHALAAYDRWR